MFFSDADEQFQYYTSAIMHNIKAWLHYKNCLTYEKWLTMKKCLGL